MTRGSGSGGGRGGLFRRLFGRRKGADDADAAPPAEPAVDEAGSATPLSTVPETAKTAVEKSATAGPATDQAGSDTTPQPDLDAQGEDDDELVLGPPQMVPAAHQGSAEAPDEDARGADEALAEEEVLVARLREAGVSGALLDGTTRQQFEMPPEAEASDRARPVQAAPAPEEDGTPGLTWLSGGKRDDGEGELPAGDSGREGREPMEAQEMNRDKETDRDEHPGSEDENAAEPVALFPGAAATEEATERVDGGEAAEDAAESEQEEARSDRSEDEADSDEPERAMAGTDDAEEGDAGTDTPDPGTPDPEPQESETEELTLGAPTAADDSTGAAAFSEGEPGAGEVPAGVEEVVRRLIREELEGELGERLSKNIRRMIREEVSHQLLRQR